MNSIYTEKQSFYKETEALNTGIPHTSHLSVLASPIDICGHTVPNRLACQAMEGCDGTATGEPDALTVRRYDRFATGGAG